jgi:hypothetical protein
MTGHEPAMTDVTAATLELLEWLADRPRTYAETMDAWRSNCPRLSAWDDAQSGGLVSVARSPGRSGDARVTLTRRGRVALAGRL